MVKYIIPNESNGVAVAALGLKKSKEGTALVTINGIKILEFTAKGVAICAKYAPEAFEKHFPGVMHDPTVNWDDPANKYVTLRIRNTEEDEELVYA